MNISITTETTLRQLRHTLETNIAMSRATLKLSDDEAYAMAINRPYERREIKRMLNDLANIDAWLRDD